MADTISYVWGVLFASGWLFLTFEFVRAAVIGRFWFWSRKRDGKKWPQTRSEAPIRFWIVWASMAGPFVFITAMASIGLFVE